MAKVIRALFKEGNPFTDSTYTFSPETETKNRSSSVAENGSERTDHRFPLIRSRLRSNYGAGESEMLFSKAEASNFNLNFSQKEDFQIDFKTQPLLPHQHSMSGPFISTGDVNGDGLEDVFIGGAARSSGMFFIQKTDGTFLQKPLNQDVEKEDMQSLLFDADGDGDLDLYVVSGGVVFARKGLKGVKEKSLYQDRFYENDGNGFFTKKENAIPEPDTILTKENGRDYANVNEAVDRLMTDVMKELRAIKPDIAIEFRQKYIGPAMRKFGNMFRAFDCPNDAVSNRIRTADVKLLCGNSAVHSDPQTWHRDEPVELAAFQVLNGFFGVPQMSVHLRNLPKAHFNMIQFYTKYWKENADNLLGGKFTPINPLANYPILKTEQNGHVIFGIFDDVIADFDGQKRIDLLNAKVSGKVAIRNFGAAGDYHLTTWNCEGKKLTDGQVTLPTGLIDLDIPQSGMASLKKI